MLNYKAKGAVKNIKILVMGALAMLIISLMLPLNAVSSETPPPIAQSFYGTVTLDGSPAPGGTSVTAEMNNRTAGSTTVSGGEYNLTINTIGGDQAGDTINFYVDGLDAGSASFDPGANTQRNLSATSPVPQRTLTMSVDGQGSTSPSVGSHNYDEGQTVNISASPATGWEFSHWEGDASGTSPSTTVTMDDDKSVTAVFTQLPSYTLSIGIQGEGSTSPSEGTHTYYEGQTVTITASPASGWDFSHWTGDASGTSPTTTVTMNENKSVGAVFTEIPTYTLTVESTDGGEVTQPGEGTFTYEEGTVVELEAEADEDYRFVNWSGGVADPDSPTTTVTMDSDKTITANFALLDEFALTIEVEGEGTTDPSPGTHIYPRDEEVEVEAIPDSGYRFDRWIGDVGDPDSATTTVTIDTDKQITAVFVPVTYYDLTIEVEGNGTTEPSPGTHQYPEGQTVSITAVADDNHKFVGWTGDVADAGEETTTVVMDRDKTVTAHFEEDLPPVIVDYDIALETRTRAVITWEANKPTTGVFEYWPEDGERETITLDDSFRMHHVVILEDLEPNTVYNFEITAFDEAGNESEPVQDSFATDYYEAEFIITGIESSVEKLEGGIKEVSIRLSLLNAGDVAGGHELSLMINGVVEESKTITVEPGEEKEVLFTHVLDQPGEYVIEIDGFVLEVEVVEDELVLSLGDWLKNNWVLVLGILIALILLKIIAIIILRRYYYIVTFVRR